MKSEEAQRWASSLDAVVVYAQGALCTRVARGPVPASGRVRVTGLPRSMDPDSLRAGVVGDSGVRVTEVRVEVDAEPTGAEAADALRQEMERLRDAYDAVQGRRDRQLSKIAEVAGLRPVPPTRKREDPPRRTPADAWLELADFTDERLRGLHGQLVQLEEELSRAEHELSVATDRWARASTSVQPGQVATTVGAVLTLDVSRTAGGSGPDDGPGAADGSGAEVEVELEYGVPGAVWVPAYRLTHRQGDDRGTLVLRASVAQRTGEDWSGVRIALATADLRRRTDLPRLRSIRVGRRQAAPAPTGWREPPAGLADLFSGYDAAGPRPATGIGALAVAGSAAPPPPPPPPAPAGYGMAPAAPAAPAGFAGPAEEFDAAMPDVPPPPRSGRP
ncbi:MAG: DUF4140 domain-containing protein, partial [Streptomycetaceae bacterium]|nr:DUF4140 domain-containing protein [Streptomycetaceae bacterium]